jgi:uncharacterized protein (DUF58 family)
MAPVVKPRLNPKARLLPALVIFLLILHLFDPYRGWAMLAAGFGSAWLCSYIWARQMAKGLSLQREVRFGWAQVGDRLEERFTLANNGWLPGIAIEIRDHSNLPGYNTSRVTGVSGLERSQWKTQGTCQRRGVFTLGPTSLIACDPLGLYRVERHDPAASSLLVLPPIVPLPFIQVAPGGRVGEGRPRQNVAERTISAATARPYLPGDSLRWVHWPTSARHDQLYVRLFESTPAGDWWIIPDLDRQVQAGEGQDATEEHVVILAASLADRGLRLRQAVGLVAAGAELSWLPPQQGGERRWELLRALAQASPGEHRLAEVLHSVRPALRQGSSLILITPDASGDWLETLLPLTWLGIVPTILLLDPRTFGRPVDPSSLLGNLAALGIAHYLIPRALLDRPEARPGQAGRWEWRVSPSGRAVPVRRPRELDWKTLS